MSEKKEFKIEFAPGCFDEFDGTQEELDELVAEITAEMQRAYESGELFDEANEVDVGEDISALDHFTSTNTRH